MPKILKKKKTASEIVAAARGLKKVTTNELIDGIFDDLVGMGSILTTIGAGVMVAVTLYMGIRFITATPEAQAKLKQQLIGLVVAGFVIFGAYFIWKIVINIVEKF